MNKLASFAIVLLSASFALGEVKMQTIEYKVGDETMEGFIAWDDSSKEPRPGVMIIHEWWGNNEYPRRRARQLAELGYVAFAADLFGQGKITDDPKQAAEWAGELRKNPDLAMERAAAGLDQLRQQSTVDQNRIAAIGYCFGGTMVLNMARRGMDVDGVVSFHASLDNLAPVTRTSVPVLILNGADDKMVTTTQLKQVENEMTQAGADVEIINYPGAVHSFTNPRADDRNIPNIAYHKEADEKSWEAMKKFFDDIFAK